MELEKGRRGVGENISMLTGIEAAFRSMKSELGMRPVYHQKESRADGHIFITLLAYHVMRAITFRLEQSGLNLSWEAIRTRLGNHVLTSVYLNSAGGEKAVVRTASEAESWHREIYRALDISGPSEKGRKAIFKIRSALKRDFENLPRCFY